MTYPVVYNPPQRALPGHLKYFPGNAPAKPGDDRPLRDEMPFKSEPSPPRASAFHWPSYRELEKWLGRLVGSKLIALVIMIAATEAINYGGGDDRSALVIGGIVWGYLLCRWRVI